MNNVVEDARINRQWVFDSLDSALDWNANAYQKTFIEKICREIFDKNDEWLQLSVRMYLASHYITELSSGEVVCPAFVWPSQNRIEISHNALLEDIF